MNVGLAYINETNGSHIEVTNTQINSGVIDAGEEVLTVSLNIVWIKSENKVKSSVV